MRNANAIRGMMVILAVTAFVLFTYTNAFTPQLGISVTKSCTDAITPNGPIQYSGVVTITGPWYPLNNVTAVDDNGTPGYTGDDVVVLGPITLAVGASASYSGSYILLSW